jgi:hypothetical protein
MGRGAVLESKSGHASNSKFIATSSFSYTQQKRRTQIAGVFV